MSPGERNDFIESAEESKKMEKLGQVVQNIQDAFLNNARREKAVVALYLLGGVKLTGRIKSFDKYSVVLETNHQEQLIFKHAISTVVLTKMPSSAATAAGVGGGTRPLIPKPEERG